MPQNPFFPRQPTSRAEIMRKKKQPPKRLDDDLMAKCKAFMSVAVPESNVIFVDEFDKFMPLFNKERHDEAGEAKTSELFIEYNGRFSPQHPIYILERTPDPNGVMYPSLRTRYKLARKIPPRFRRLSTLNELGEKVPTLINAFFNATTNPSGPGDHRKEQYAKAIASALVKADTKTGGDIKKQRAEYAKEAAALVRSGRVPDQPSAKSPEDEQPSGPSTVSEGLISWD